MADWIERLSLSILPITSSTPGEDGAFGTGFIVGRSPTSAYLVTCAHVIRDVGGDGVRVNSAPARVIACGSPDGPDDVAVLETAMPPGARPVWIELSARTGQPCIVAGFDVLNLKTKSKQYHLKAVPGSLGLRTVGYSSVGGAPAPIWDLKMESPLKGGYSGSPVIDSLTGDVIGIAATARSGEATATAIAVEALRAVWPDGMQRIYRPRVVYRGTELIYVPPGPFSMGTPDSHARALALDRIRPEFEKEAPQSQVHVQGFYIARLPVSNAQYAEFTAATSWRVPFQSDPMSLPFSWNRATRRYPDQGEHWPVVLVSWHDALEYCAWLGARLCTEAEWEKAARGSESAREWPWGSLWSAGRCNTVEGGRKMLAAVGEYSPAGDSPYGVADLSGNTWEWCSSLDEPYPYEEDERENPAAVGLRILRGGAWGNDRYLARCASRNSAAPETTGFTIGFRVAMSKDALRNELGVL